MTDSMRQKLEELRKLRAENLITEQEYAAARGNIFLDAGFDILPRTELDAQYAYAPRQREERERRGCGCGCFLTLLLLIVALLGGLFALPEDIRATLPGLNRIFEIEQVQEARRVVLRFIDDLMGHPERQVPIPPSETSSDRLPTESTTAVPAPAPAGSEAQSDLAQNKLSPAREGDREASPASPDLEEPSLRSPIDGDVEQPETTTDSVKSSIRSNSARIRFTPDSSSDDNIIRRVRKGEALTILEELTNDSGERWYRVRMDRGEEGWVSARLVEPIEEE